MFQFELQNMVQYSRFKIKWVLLSKLYGLKKHAKFISISREFVYRICCCKFNLIQNKNDFKC